MNVWYHKSSSRKGLKEPTHVYQNCNWWIPTPMKIASQDERIFAYPNYYSGQILSFSKPHSYWNNFSLPPSNKHATHDHYKHPQNLQKIHNHCSIKLLVWLETEPMKANDIQGRRREGITVHKCTSHPSNIKRLKIIYTLKVKCILVDLTPALAFKDPELVWCKSLEMTS